MATTAMRPDEPDGEPDTLSPEQLWAIFDADSQRALGISAEEFLRRWDAGVYHGDEEDEPSRRARGLEFLMLLVTPDRFRAVGR